jgi:oligoribonuclease
MKYVSIDIETTGLNPDTCSVIEFGAVIDDTEKPKPLDQLPRFHQYIDIVSPNNIISGEPYALSMHSKIFKLFADPNRCSTDFCKPGYLCSNFREFLFENGHYQPINVAGKNFAGFDLQFLRRLPNWDIKIHHRIIDPTILFLKASDINLPDTKTCKERANIAGEVAHTAIEDCLDVIKLVRVGLGCI